MKIEISEKESYEIEVPDKVDAETFRGIVSRFNEIDKMIAKINYRGNEEDLSDLPKITEIIDKEIDNDNKRKRSERSFGYKNRYAIKLGIDTRTSAIRFLEQYLKMTTPQIEEFVKKNRMKKVQILYNMVNYLKNKYNLRQYRKQGGGR